MENKRNGLIIVLVIIIAVLCLVIGCLLGSKFADNETKVLKNSNDTEENLELKDNEDDDNLVRIINCNGTFPHQYGEVTQEKRYIFNNNVFTGIEAIVKYDFGTEELAKNMSNRTLVTVCAEQTVECNSTQESQYITINIKINEENLNNIADFQKYKNLTINDILNKNIEDNSFFSNQDMTCTEQK